MAELIAEDGNGVPVRGMGDGEPERSLRDIYYVLFRHKWKVISVFFAVMVGAGLYTFLPPEAYESQAKVLVRVGQESILDRTGSDGLITSVRPSEESQINTEVDILRSSDLAEKVVESIGLAAFLSPSDVEVAAGDTAEASTSTLRAEVADRVMRSLSIEPQRRGSIVYISYRARSPQLAQQVVSSLMEFYLDKHLEVHRSPASHDFFAGQIEQVRGKLVGAQEELRKLKNETGIASVDEQRGIILQRIGALQRDVQQADAAAFASGAKIEAIQKRLSELPETVVVTQTTQKRLSLGREEPTGTTVTQGINTARQGMESALLTEETTLSSLRAQAQTLRGQLRAAQAALGELNDNAVRFKELEREIEILEAKYRKYSENLEQSRVDKTLETEKISNVSVLQPATYPLMPVPREGGRKLIVGFFLAVFGGLGLAFVSEYMDHSLKKPEDVEAKLRLRTLASIPRLSGQAIRSVKQLGAPSAAARRRLPGKSKAEDEATTGPKSLELVIPSEVGELYDYETLPERLFLSADGSQEQPRVVALTSCYSGEGVTTVASHLAVMLAEHSDKRVLFVDANLRHPSAHRVFGVNLSPGLTEFLSDPHGSPDIIQRSSVPNLDVVSSGDTNTSFSRKSELKALDGVLRHWREQYRFVVLDTPAVRGGMLAGVLGSLVDGVVLVVEAERVRWEVVRRVHERLVRAKANVLGVALNKRRFYIPEWLYKKL